MPLVRGWHGAALGSSHVGRSGHAALAGPADAQVAQLASVRRRSGGRDDLAGRLAAPARACWQYAELGIHLRVAELLDLRRGLLGQDRQGGTSTSPARRPPATLEPVPCRVRA